MEINLINAFIWLKSLGKKADIVDASIASIDATLLDVVTATDTTVTTPTSIPAVEISSADVGNYYAGTNVEAILQEVGLNKASREPISVNGVDMNTVKTSGTYYGYNMTNSASLGISAFQVIAYSPDWIVQIQYRIIAGILETYKRSWHSGTTWSAWQKVLFEVQGTFTPVLTPNVGAFGSYTATGKYTKIGNVVIMEVGCQILNMGTASVAFKITGLPFASAIDKIAVMGKEHVAYGTTMTAYQTTTANNTSMLEEVRRYDMATCMGNAYAYSFGWAFITN